MATSGKSQLSLVHWITDDKVGLLSTRARVEAEVGTIVKMKWKIEKIPYNVEVFKLSGTVNLHSKNWYSRNLKNLQEEIMFPWGKNAFSRCKQ